MLTPAQCRAARAFLNWTLVDLAAASGLSRASLNSFEGGHGNAKADTIAAIQKALETAGIEFTEEPGVRLKGQKLEVWRLQGKDVMAKLSEDIYQTCLKMGGELLSTGMDETKYQAVAGTEDLIRNQIKRMLKIGVKERAILCEGDRHFVFPPAATTYRWIARELFGMIPTMTYGNKHAIVVYGPPVSVVITENEQIAQLYRQQFEILWSLAKTLAFTEEEIAAICEKNLPLKAPVD